MKKQLRHSLICLGLILSLLIPSLAVQAATPQSTRYGELNLSAIGISFGLTTSPGVNVRRTARSNGQVITSVRNKGTPIIIVGSQTVANVLWYAVYYDGQQAYIRSDMIAIIDQSIYIGMAGTDALYDLLDTYYSGGSLQTFSPQNTSRSGSSGAVATPRPTAKPTAAPTARPVQQAPANSGIYVWLSATGTKYHSINNCGNMNPANATQVTLETAKARGMTPCSKCNPPR